MKTIEFVASDESSTVQGLIDEILSVVGQIHVAEYRLLELIRKLDQLRPWRQSKRSGRAG